MLNQYRIVVLSTFYFVHACSSVLLVQLTKEQILMRLDTVAVLDLRMCMKED